MSALLEMVGLGLRVQTRATADNGEVISIDYPDRGSDNRAPVSTEYVRKQAEQGPFCSSSERVVPTVSTTALSELVRFLLNRVDEDDDELRALRRQRLRGSASAPDLAGVRSVERQRAECGAKRAVIGQVQRLLVLRDLPSEKAVRDAASHVLRAMAMPYRDHYAFRPEWTADDR